MGTSAGDGEDDYAAAVKALHHAWARVLGALRALEPQRHFDEATDLGPLARQFESESVEERADAAVRIQEAESLTLTVLGKRTRMTKQAAGRLTSRARRRRKEQ
jgi:hypothetical protein